MKLIEVSIEAIRAAINNNAGGIIIIMPVGGWDEDLITVWLLILNFVKALAFNRNRFTKRRVSSTSLLRPRKQGIRFSV